MLRLSNLEKETIIIFNEDEKTASVHTYNKKLMNELRKIRAERTECCCERETEDFAEYILPKSWVKVRAPRQLSDEQKQILRERALVNLKRSAK